VSGRVAAGEDLAELQDDFHLTREQIEEALRFEDVPLPTAA
jgi:uncharacterized protein (DUF433 family)